MPETLIAILVFLLSLLTPPVAVPYPYRILNIQQGGIVSVSIYAPRSTEWEQDVDTIHKVVIELQRRERKPVRVEICTNKPMEEFPNALMCSAGLYFPLGASPVILSSR